MMEPLVYHLQVAIVQSIALLAYRLLLADLPLGHLKRLYLLAALGASFLVPGWLVVGEVPAVVEWLPAAGTDAVLPAASAVASGPFASASSGWLVLYWAGVLVSATALLVGLRQIWQQRKRATYVDTRGGVRLYSLPTAAVPHAFGRWVFYPLDRPLSPVVLRHELAHARQWHTLDRLLVRLLCVFCWFNPVLRLYDRAIRQNHEYLADRAALRRSGLSVAAYQNELLHHLGAPRTVHPLSSAMSFSFTKKRMLMLATRLPSTGQLLGRIALIAAVWSGLLFGFAERVAIAQSNSSTPARLQSQRPTPSAPAEMTYGAYRAQLYAERRAANPQLPPAAPISAELADLPLSEYRRMRYEAFRAEPASPPTAAQLAAFRDPRKYRVWIDGREVPNERVADYTPADIFNFTSAQPRHNPNNLTSIGLITHERRARTARRLLREAELLGPPAIERVD